LDCTMRFMGRMDMAMTLALRREPSQIVASCHAR